MLLNYFLGGGNGNPLQYSCLENSMNGGAWQAAVHGVAKSQTRLSNFTFSFYFHALEKEMAAHSSVLAWRIPGTGEPGGLPSMGLHRVRHDWSDLAAAANYFLGFSMYGSFKLLMNSWLSLCGRLLTIFYCIKAFSNLCNLRIKNTESLQWKGGIRSPFSTLYTPIKVILFLMHPSRISLCIYKQMQIYIFLPSSLLCL